MLKRFTVVLVILMIAASMGTVFAAPTMSDSKKTMNDLIQGEQMISNEKDAITALKDQMVLMMYIRAIDQMMNGMTPEQIKTTAQSFIKTGGQERYIAQGTQETKEQLMTYTRQQMLQMNEDQLSSMLDKGLLVTSLNAQRNMLKDNNIMVTKPRGLALD